MEKVSGPCCGCESALPGTVTRLPVMGKALHVYGDGGVLCGEYCLKSVLTAYPAEDVRCLVPVCLVDSCLTSSTALWTAVSVC